VRGANASTRPASAPGQWPLPTDHCGFTLVELLVVVTIITILASIALGALSAARESARVAKTKATIAKIDRLVEAQYQSYMTRRVTCYHRVESPPGSGTWQWVPVDVSNLRPLAVNLSNLLGGSVSIPRLQAAVRLAALRELMRMEMPDRFSDFWTDKDPTARTLPLKFTFDPNAMASPNKDYYPKASTTDDCFSLCRFTYVDNSNSANDDTPVLPSATRAYRRRYQNRPPAGYYDSAECLYLWITTLFPGAREQFTPSEIGDVDNDGWPEFIDAWGNPIKFLRWAPAFAESDIQAKAWRYDKAQDKWVVDLNAMDRASRDDHDPFDPARVDLVQNPGNSYPPRGWRLAPLVYSAGPDGIYGINVRPSDKYSGNPYAVWNGKNWVSIEIGRPLDPRVSGESDNQSATGPPSGNGPFDHQDNIHNHRTDL
jgi:prepilin-type N-terminal cleavage/methylation domain-containing protein